MMRGSLPEDEPAFWIEVKGNRETNWATVILERRSAPRFIVRFENPPKEYEIRYDNGGQWLPSGVHYEQTTPAIIRWLVPYIIAWMKDHPEEYRALRLKADRFTYYPDPWPYATNP